MSKNGATLKDSTHELYIYKCEDKSKMNPEQYLKLPSNTYDTIETNTSSSGYSRSSKEVFHITTLLCSTKLTQNGKFQTLIKDGGTKKKIIQIF